MIEIDEYFEIGGFDHAIRGMRNSHNSWDKSDSVFLPNLYIGKNDLDLMKKLCRAGTDHRKFLRMIVVYADITAPLYWWKEYDTYKVGTVANSCSTMHNITDKEFTESDFSCEHIEGSGRFTLSELIDLLNEYRQDYIELHDKETWYSIIQLLPSSYNQKRTVMLNYEVLANIYKSRKNHKLDEWREFCYWIESLPYSELITMQPENVYTANEDLKNKLLDAQSEIDRLNDEINELLEQRFDEIVLGFDEVETEERN